MSLFVLTWYGLKAGEPLFKGVLTYLLVSLSLRTFIPKDHRAGMKLTKQEKYLDAIPHFEKSYDFFKKHNWLDKYRYLTLLSSSKMAYREMALNNIAFCYGQAGDGIRSKEYYEKTLREFPDNGMAKVGLKMLNAMNQKNDNINGEYDDLK